MQKIFTIILSIILSSSSIAQSFVSTSPENKNVVLEEFTGIYCGYCPDGHVIAQGIADNNPGDVVLINIHVGTYANPSGGDPDFRTQWGEAIKNQTGLAGYPAGTVNRHDYSSQGWDQNGGTAMSRGNWNNASNDILSNSSYVNVAAQSSIDVSSRLLTVNVEAYFTGNGNRTDKINVFLLQNNVEGPQSNGVVFNPSAILPNGNYNHQHMLRHSLTGQWGDDITNTSQGSLYSNTYTYSIPSDLNGVAYDLFNMEVVVFVADDQQEIISGNKSSMSFILPPGVSLTDLEANTNMTLPSNYCTDSITPEITVTNNSNIAVDTFDVSYTLNSNAPVSQTIYSALAPSASVTYSFPTTALPYGANNIIYDVNLNNSSSFVDSIFGNNFASSGEFNTMSSTAFASTHSEGFETYSTGSTNLSNAIVENPLGVNTYVVDQTVSSSVNWNLGAYGNSAKSYRFRFYNGWDVGDEASIVFENLDLSNSTNSEVTFSHAYAQLNSGTNDKLEILVSTDCGSSWTSLFNQSGSTLSTTSPYSGGYYYPQVDQWNTTYLDLSAFDGQSSVMLKFKATSDDGNNLYIDDISVGENLSSINESIFNNNLKIFPNPINNLGTLEFIIERSANISYEIYDILGQKVKGQEKINLNPGNHLIDINTQFLENGTYFIKCQINDECKVLQFIVSH
ncbi:MAG: hypothetical protein CL853_02530 [Crocinitomicaceae bacterium]|nr:hypothetical protein [Crocinitomicaceae bacterium]